LFIAFICLAVQWAILQQPMYLRGPVGLSGTLGFATSELLVSIASVETTITQLLWE